MGLIASISKLLRNGGSPEMDAISVNGNDGEVATGPRRWSKHIALVVSLNINLHAVNFKTASP